MSTPFLSKIVFGDDSPLSRAFHDMNTYPNVKPNIMSRNARAIGQAGEDLVDSMTRRHGLVLARVPDGLSSDRLLQLPRRALTVQIKTRTNPVKHGYVFTMQKGYRRSPAGQRAYDPGEIDLAVCVILPLNFVFFTAAKTPRITLKFEQIRRFQGNTLASLELALRDILAPCPDKQLPFPDL